METEKIILLFILIIFGFINSILGYKLIYKQAKKANYNCLKCSVYDCPSKHCIKKKGV